MLIDAARSLLVIIDIQERLCPVMDDPRRVLFNAARLLKGATLLDVPVICTEQYPTGLGPTMIDVRELLPEGAVIEKTSFGSMGEAAFRDALERTGRDQVVLLGTEAHVCVLQTALGLREAGMPVFVVEDACGSRRPESERAAMARARDAGCGVVTTEMVLFEWLADKSHPAFKQIMALVR
ncbi:hydrolase [Roseospira marina]|uniref:Hydrolase n=1 Tax=Roseospira marina TaxID=140057 RepID=A0A5M6ICL6_9PROT|nr:hydrolase [Roseospira marina]KAA5605368.1 hydrolase [Roseospira marina]MBB4314648.1 nicotinamidase-related amidase [Roseospira marina]MBB5088747.1 nicotinamidase-related amidase [Roseospira marina]